jgi:hypothetical protein
MTFMQRAFFIYSDMFTVEPFMMFIL